MRPIISWPVNQANPKPMGEAEAARWPGIALSGWACLLILGLFPSKSAGAAPASGPAYESVLIRDVPHVKQKPDFCGEACAEMFLRKLGSPLTQDDVFNAGGVDPLLGRGCHAKELAAALTASGFEIGSGWYQIQVARASAELDRQFSALHADLARGVPVIVCMRTGVEADASEHFRLILGYDVQTDAVVYHEPAAADGAYRQMARAEFLACWPLQYDPKLWTVIRFRLEPKAVARGAAPARKGFTSADYAQHMMELRKKIPGPDFAVVLEPPFMVIGDEDAGTVKLRAAQTVRWAATHLKDAYFTKDPASIIDIWLFKDKDSYAKHTRSIFHDEPTTPFGYSSAAQKALIMNISTGGGTLVHEMVHAYLDANFPARPAWFNEGLASLYEQSADKDGVICGLPNWRLEGLQKAIKGKGLPSFEKLSHTTENEFYTQDRGTNYAQARYLCYYLQEKGLLQKYYRKFAANAEKDPTGYDTLVAVLDQKDMAAFQKKWETFVLGLKYP